MASVKSRVADGFVAAIEVAIGECIDSSETFGDVIAGEFDVNSARPCSFCSVGSNKTFDFCDNRIKVAGFATVLCGIRISVHWVACPDDRVTRIFHCTQKRAKTIFDDVSTHASDQREASGNHCGVERLAERNHLITGH